MELARRRAWDLHNNTCKVKGTYVQACAKFFHLPTEQLKNKLSHLEKIVDRGASLHMMIKKNLFSGEKDAIRGSKEPTVITIASGKPFLLKLC